MSVQTVLFGERQWKYNHYEKQFGFLIQIQCLYAIP